MRYRLFEPLHFLQYLKKLHISYNPSRQNVDIARRLILYTSSNGVKEKYPNLLATWELLEYNVPATMDVEFVDGKKEKMIIDGYSHVERKRIVDKWKLEASLEPCPEVLAPTASEQTKNI